MDVKQRKSDNHCKHVNTSKEVVHICLHNQLLISHFLQLWLEIKVRVIWDLEHYIEKKESIVPEKLSLALFLKSELQLNNFPFCVVLFVGTRSNNLSILISFLYPIDPLSLGEAEQLGNNDPELQ